MRAGERAAAKDDGADGANGLIIGNADISAFRFFLDGHFRNDGNTHARANHAEKAAELAALENNLRMKTRAVACCHGAIAEAMAVAQQQEWLGTKILEGKRPAGGELVIFWECSKQTFGEKRRCFEFVATDRQCENGDVYGTGSEALEKHGRDLFDDREPDLGEFAREGGKAWREEVRRDGGNDPDDDGTADEGFAFDDVALGGFQFAKDGAGARQKSFAKLGQPDGAAETVKEPRAEFIFQLEDLLGE